MAQTFTQNVKIHFDSDTNAAKQKINELYSSLRSISSANPMGDAFTGSIASIQKASQAASELAQHLQRATNVNTGKINLKTFNNELLKNNKTLQYYRQTLSSIGPEGTKAFRQLTQAIITAEQPLFNFGVAMKSLGTTLLNSAKWQISSMAIHGIMGAAQKATGHVKALNSSLNDIRIVTGQNTEQMDKFAQKANKMAKELSTTTTAYTDAALIFYQQGLDDSAVEERTNTVIKMANVTGEAAEDVSSYMTAVWNNFNDGTKSLEYYADAMTALGAATASSTEEIAAGLDKFASIANTVGLSYEYATAALATVVSETRQSADVVGTAFKTLFSRLESLQLGETLDDGTSLNKYSAALATVGVNIKDQQGQLKDMDQILDELGGKWQNLSRDQQVALAQTVAGTRQYTQLISLMENYEKFKGNVDIASGAGGTLQEQADIYAESWEAASKRVQASAENIYQALLDDDLFIGLNNTFSSFLDSIGAVIDGMGGLKGILPLLTLLMNQLFGSHIANGIDNIITKITGGKDALAKLRQEAVDLHAQSYQNEAISTGTTIQGSENLGQNINLTAIQTYKDAYDQYLSVSKQLSDSDKKLYESRLKNMEVVLDSTMELGKQLTKEEQILEAQKKQLTNEDNLMNMLKKQGNSYTDIVASGDSVKSLGVTSNNTHKQAISKTMSEYIQNMTQGANLSSIANSDAIIGSIGFSTNYFQDLGPELANITQQANSANIEFSNIKQGIVSINSLPFSNMIGEIERVGLELDTTEELLGEAGITLEEHFGDAGAKALRQVNNASKDFVNKSKAMQVASKKVAQLQKDGRLETEEGAIALKDLAEKSQLAQASQNQLTQSQTDLTNSLITTNTSAKKCRNILEQLGFSSTIFDSLEAQAKETGESVQDLTKKYIQLKLQSENPITPPPPTIGQSLQSLGSDLSKIAMGINAIKSLGDIWSDEDASTGEKILSTMMSMSMILPMLTSLKLKDNVVNLATAVANKLVAAGKGGEAAARLANAAAANVESVSVATALSVLLPYIAAIAAIIAVVALLVSAIGDATDAYNADAIAAQNAKEAAKELSDQYEQTKQAFEDLKSSLGDYQGALDGIKELTEGTQEWKKAIQEVNSQAMDLISTYPELTQYADWEGGILTIDEEGMDQVLDKYQQETQQAQNVSTIANINAKQAQLQSNKTDLRRELMGSGVDTLAAFTEGLEIAKSGAEQFKQQQENEFNDALEQLDTLRDNGDLISMDSASVEALLKQSGVSEDLAKAISENTKAVLEQIDAQEALEDTEKELVKAQTMEQFSTKESFQTSDYQEAIGAFAAEGAYAAGQEAYNKTMKEDWATDYGLFGDSMTKAGEEAVKEYMNSIGITDYEITDAGENPIVEYVDSAGEVIEKTITKDMVAATRQVQAQSKAAEDNYDQILSATEKMSESEEGQSILKAYGEGKATNVRLSDLEFLDGASLTNEIFNLTAEEIAAMGGDEAFKEKMREIKNAADKEKTKIEASATTITKDIMTSEKSGFDEATKNLTINEYQDFVEQINQLGIKFGREGAQTFIDETNKLKTAFADNENIDAFIGEVSNMDLTSEDSAEAVKALGESYGISGEALDAFINTIDDFALVTEESADKVRGVVASIDKVVKDMEYGDTISGDDYQALLDAGIEGLDSYFTEMADGTYMLTGSAKEFLSLVNNNKFTLVDNNIKTSRHTIEQLEQQKALGMQVTDDFKSFGGYVEGKEEGRYNSDAVAAQIQYLKDLQDSGVDTGITAEQFDAWKADLTDEDGHMSDQYLQAISDAIKNNTLSQEEYDALLEEQNQILQDNINLRALMSTSLEELNQMLLEGSINIEAYHKALDGVIISELQKLDIDTKEYEAYYKTLQSMGVADEQAKKIAASNLKLNKGVSNLSENWEEWNKELIKGNKASSQYAVALQGIKDALGMILDIDAEKLSDSFYESAENLALIGKAAEGDTEAIEELQISAAKDIAISISARPEAKDDLIDLINSFQTELPDLEFGANLNTTSFGQALMQLLADSKISVDQAQDILNSLGFEPEIEYVKMPFRSAIAAGHTTFYSDNAGTKIEGSQETIAEQYGEVWVPTINAKKTKYQGPPSAILNQSNKKDSSGGGGGREKKKYDDEFDRYHEIEREMEALERETSRLGEAKDLAFGASKVALINQETEALKNELDALEQLNSEVEAYLAQDKANIAQFGAEFDEFGNISNYDEITQYALDQYNSGAWSEEKYEAFKEYLEQYEETLDKWNDTQDDMTAKQREILEKQLEKIELEVQLKIDVSEDSLEYLEYQLSKIEDEAFAAADAIALITEEIGATMDQGKAYRQGLSDLEAQAAQNVADGIAVESGGWTEDMIAQAKEYKSALLENNQQLEEYRKLIEEKITEALDEMNEKLDEQIGRFDTYGAVLGHYTTILGLSGKSIKNASLIIDLGNKTVDNSINKLESTRHKQEVLEQSLIDAQAEYEAALNRGDSEAAEYWRETIEDITMQVEQGKETLLATFEETLQTAADTFAAAVEQTVATLSAALTKYSSLEVAQDQYDKQKEVAERFLDINTKNYELSKLMRNINAEINKTDNLAAKTKLRDVLEEINDIQANNNEMTQYDLDMLNAKYQLRLAEIALEEARNAKSQVRLTQTAGGGWGYVYTADQAKIDQAQQNYEDKLYEMQQLSQERIAELSDYILQNQQEMNDAIANLRAEDFESREAYLAEIDRIRDYYLEKDQYLHEQLGKAVEDSGQKYSDTIISQIENAESWEEAHQNVVDATNEALDGENGMVSHYDNWEKQVSDAYKAAGISENNFKDQVIKDAKDISKASDQVSTALQKEAKEYSDYLTSIITTIAGFQDQYNTIIDGVITANENVVISTNNMIAGYANAANAAVAAARQSIQAAAAAQQAWASVSGGGSGGGGGGELPIPDTIDVNGPVSVTGGKEQRQYNGSTFMEYSDGYWVEIGSYTGHGSSQGGLYNVVDNIAYSEDYLRSLGIPGFDSGGYTGSWGSEGRMAILHEKEIVLNKMDTANLLASVDIVRQIAQSIDAIGQYQRMQELISAYGISNTPTQQLEQNVHITADFPNVTDHNEIEEAINNLLNYSSQYINRYR